MLQLLSDLEAFKEKMTYSQSIDSDLTPPTLRGAILHAFGTLIDARAQTHFRLTVLQYSTLTSWLIP